MNPVTPIQIHGNSNGLRLVSVILVNTVNGWAAMQNQFHDCIGVKSVDQSAEAIVVNFDFTAKKVFFFHAIPDDGIVKTGGLICGASIGLDKAIIYCSPPGQPAINPASITSAGNIQCFGLFL